MIIHIVSSGTSGGDSSKRRHVTRDLLKTSIRKSMFTYIPGGRSGSKKIRCLGPFKNCRLYGSDLADITCGRNSRFAVIMVLMRGDLIFSIFDLSLNRVSKITKRSILVLRLSRGHQ